MRGGAGLGVGFIDNYLEIICDWQGVCTKDCPTYGEVISPVLAGLQLIKTPLKASLLHTADGETRSTYTCASRDSVPPVSPTSDL